MLQCSICKKTPTRRCISCDKILFCNECLHDHLESHIEKHTSCAFEKITFTLSNKNMRLLKQIIKSANEAIENQKKYIIKETSKAISQLKTCMKQAFEMLEKIRHDYNEFSDKITFEEKEFAQVKKILKKNLIFEYPYFTQIEGILTKNSRFMKIDIKEANLQIIESEYGFLPQGHTSKINSLAISNDNKYLVSGSGSNSDLEDKLDNTVRIWNLLEKKQELVFKGHTKPVTSVAITSDNKFAVSGSDDGTLRIWNLLNKKQEHMIENNKARITSIAISNDNTFIVYGLNKKTIIIWHLIDKVKSVINLEGKYDIVNCIAITTDNKFIMLGSDYLRVVSMYYLYEISKYKKDTYSVYCIAIFKDNSFVACSSINIVIWNIIKRTQEAILVGHKNKISSIAITKDDLILVSISQYDILIVWDLVTYNKKYTIDGKRDFCPQIVITNDSSLFFESSFSCIQVWDFHKRKQINEFPCDNSKIKNITLSEDSHYLVSVSDMVIIWNIPERRKEEILKATPTSIAISNDNRYLVLGSKFISIWNMIEKKYETELKGHEGIVTSLKITDDGQIISGSDDKTVRLWNLSKKQQEAVFRGHKSKVNAIALSIDNLHFSVSTSELIIWNLDDKKPLFESSVYKMYAISENETICILSKIICKKKLCIWNLLSFFIYY